MHGSERWRRRFDLDKTQKARHEFGLADNQIYVLFPLEWKRRHLFSLYDSKRWKKVGISLACTWLKICGHNSKLYKSEKERHIHYLHMCQKDIDMFGFYDNKSVWDSLGLDES